MDDVVILAPTFFAIQIVFWFGWLGAGSLIELFRVSVGDAR